MPTSIEISPLTAWLTLVPLPSMAEGHESSFQAWWQLGKIVNHPIYPDIPFYTLKEELAQVAVKESLATFNQAQQLVASYVIQPLEKYLTSLSSKRQTYLRHALYLSTQKALQAQPSRFPKPSDAPQPLWDRICEEIKQLDFDLTWKTYTQKKALVTCHDKTWSWPLMADSTLSWKLKVQLAEAYQEKKPHPFSHLPLHLHEQMGLDDQAISQTLESLQPQSDLKLTKCKLAGPLSAAVINKSLKNLEHLSLDGCSKLPLPLIEFHQAKNLRTLSLKNARLQEELNQLQALSRLHTLDLAESDLLSDQIVKMPPCPSIKRLSLDSCKDLSSMGFELLSLAMPNVRDLNVSRCSGMHGKVALEWPPLQHLQASWCDGIDDTLVDYLIDRHPLRSLTLAHSRYLTHLGAEAIGELSLLTHLDLSHCLSVTYDGLESCLSKLPHIKSLHLSGQDLYEPAQWFEHLSQLEKLSLPLHVKPEALLKLPSHQLTYLNMGHCAAWSTEEFFYFFTSPVCSKLETLIIEEACSVNDRALMALSQITTLKALSLAGTPDKPQLFHDHFHLLSHMPHLERLELSYGGRCDYASMKKLFFASPSLRRVELGPMYRLHSQDIENLRKAAPWIYLTCFGYEGLTAF